MFYLKLKETFYNYYGPMTKRRPKGLVSIDLRIVSIVKTDDRYKRILE